LKFRRELQGSGSVYLLRFRTSWNGAILGVLITNSGKLAIRNDYLGVATTDTKLSIPMHSWQDVQIHIRVPVSGTTGRVDVWFNGVQSNVLAQPMPFTYYFDEVAISTVPL
jgi:hypothetical protein